MATFEELRQQIRYQLDQLSSTNRHHEFEHLCRGVARARICSNILPATGPVGAGGDRGRDFETFRSYLADEGLRDSTFIGQISSGLIVFACSLKRASVASKIRSDVRKIMKGSESTPALRPPRIVTFVSTDLPIGKRLETQEWAAADYSVALDVFDGQAITELLCDPELFHLAQEYLRLPSEIFPALADGSEAGKAYNALKEHWSVREPQPTNLGDFESIKRGVRHATFEAAARADLDLWLEKLRPFLASTFRFLRRRAEYELIVASLRGKKSLDGLEATLDGYCNGFPEIVDAVEFEDAEIIVTYLRGAASRGIPGAPTDQAIDGWSRSLAGRLDAELKRKPDPGLRCSLLETRGYLAIFGERLDFAAALKYWRDVVRLAPRAPLYPLERFADRLTSLIGLGIDTPELAELTRKTDPLLASRFGEVVAGQKARDRAMAFYDRGQLREAVRELHAAKVSWFANESLYGCVLAIRTISHMFLEMGLSVAAKHYALAAAQIASGAPSAEVRAQLAMALMDAAQAEFSQGNWKGFFLLARVALRAHGILSTSGGNEERSAWEAVMFNAALATGVAQRLEPELLEWVHSQTEELRISGEIESLQDAVSLRWPVTMAEAEIWQSLESELVDRPFADSAAERTVRWRQLGITWVVRFRNDQPTAGPAEEILSTLQILLVELSTKDLCLLPTEVKIRIAHAAGESGITVNRGAGEDAREWSVTASGRPLSSRERVRYDASALTILLSILRTVSVLPTDGFHRLTEDVLKEGLFSKVFLAKPYAELAAAFVTDEMFTANYLPHREAANVTRPFSGRQHPEMSWRSSPGPGYSSDEAELAVRRRYERSRQVVRFTMRRLCEDATFREVAARLREDGWKDWHILMAVAGVAVNSRLNQARPWLDSVEAFRKRTGDLFDAPERENEALAPALFTEAELRLSLRLSMLSTLKGWGLLSTDSVPDMDAVERFLAGRYQYWETDVDHEFLC